MAFQLFTKTLLLDDLADAFEKYKKVISDLAEKQEKKVAFTTKKGQVFVETSQYASLISSCVHLFRNVVDHGIETAEERALASKPECAQVVLHFEIKINQDQTQKMIQIKLEDDGRGINPELIKRKLVEKELKKVSELANLTDHEIIQFIFLPQFSSADQVTLLSGRGVGLDALRMEALNLGGQVWVESTFGKGSQFIIEIPFLNQTLAVAS